MSTITNAINDFIQIYVRNRNTAATYDNALQLFAQILADHNLSPDEHSPADLSEDAISWFITALKDHAATTERLYLTAVIRFYNYLVAENLASLNLARVRLLAGIHRRPLGRRLPQFPLEDIETLINHCINLINTPVENDTERLRHLRDRAFVLTLADTGLRVHEACGLDRGSIKRHENYAIVRGKGNSEDVVRFSQRSMRAITDYLDARSKLDGSSGRQLGSLPLFARHDKGAGKHIRRMTTTTGRNIIAQRVAEALGEAAVGTITPHSLRHYFVTRVLKASGNLKLAQELARHRSITVTQRYAHLSNDELDQGYYEIFEQRRTNKDDQE
ncbi:MAG TPA: tyrosine-type recombinase/integrase [Anaerolineaceae bacterium]|nr:tyrosine-type recombinase/integrase [Anaerolineaceae bacterium]